MTHDHDKNMLCPFRKRQYDMLSFLAYVAVHGHDFPADETDENLRQYGYGADLARGRTGDLEMDRNLENIVLECQKRLSGKPPENKIYKDPIQKDWGASWYINPGNLVSEFFLHIMREKKKNNLSTCSFEPA